MEKETACSSYASFAVKKLTYEIFYEFVLHQFLSVNLKSLCSVKQEIKVGRDLAKTKEKKLSTGSEFYFFERTSVNTLKTII